MQGRAAGSTDNCQATHFFLINASGTYILKPLKNLAAPAYTDPASLIERARLCKRRNFDHRVDFPRHFPFYLDSDRFLSNLASLARCVLGLMSAETGFDFAADIDVCGGIMWI
jgi:hypothetical protein